MNPLARTNFRVKHLGKKKDIQLIGKYEIDSDFQYYEIIDFLVDMINEKNVHERKSFPLAFNINFYSSLEFVLGKCKMQEEICTICMEEFMVRDFELEASKPYEDDIFALACSHKFHRMCLEALINKKEFLKCPICSVIFGRMVGDQPEGTLQISLNKGLKCDGYHAGTIVLQYNFKGGVRNGKDFPGTNRVGYLPDTPEGREVRDLLKEAFQRKLTFTIGRSVTTNMDNQIVWNGIHHKTNPSGGAANFGYPDPTYLKRVKEELALKGITGIGKQ